MLLRTNVQALDINGPQQIMLRSISDQSAGGTSFDNTEIQSPDKPKTYCFPLQAIIDRRVVSAYNPYMSRTILKYRAKAQSAISGDNKRNT